jgi:hypothetical protein
MRPPGVPFEVVTLEKRNPLEVITSQGPLDQGTALGGVLRTSPRQGWNCLATAPAGCSHERGAISFSGRELVLLEPLKEAGH